MFNLILPNVRPHVFICWITSHKLKFLCGHVSERLTLLMVSSHTYISGGSRISRRGGVDLVGGGVDSRGAYVLKNLGACAGHAPLDPPMYVSTESG